MKNLLIISIVFVSLLSCQKEEIAINKSSLESKPTLLQVADEIPKSSMEFNIDKGIFEGKKITLTISHGGGCDPNHSFKLYHKIKATYDCHPEEFYLVFTTSSGCKRLDYTELTFDLTNEQFCNNKIFYIKGGIKDLEITL